MSVHSPLRQGTSTDAALFAPQHNTRSRPFGLSPPTPKGGDIRGDSLSRGAPVTAKSPHSPHGHDFSRIGVLPPGAVSGRDAEQADPAASVAELDDEPGAGPPAPAPAPAAPAPAAPTPAPAPATPQPPWAPSLGAIVINIPQNIRNASTPAAMAANRIPPRVDTPVAVQISGWHPPFLPVTFSIDNASAANGTATINGAATADLVGNGTLNLRGGTQTSPGNAGNLRLVARIGPTQLATSGGFSVSSIPQNFSVTFNSQINTATMRGLAVNNHWESDSTNVADLDEAERSEQVQYGTATGIWAGVVGGNNSGYLPANSPPLVDSHGTPLARFTGPGSRIAEQTFTFNDKRTGATDIPAKRSGFRLTRTAVVNGAGQIEFTVDKNGTATTANGFSSAAGSGRVTRTQII